MQDRQRLAAMLLEGAQAHGYFTDLWTLKRAAQVIEKHFGLHYHHCYVWEILRRMKWSPQKPRCLARERDEARIERWRKVDWPRVKKAHRKRMTIALIDERGFMLQGVRARTWAPRGHTPVQRVAGPRKHISVISAITVSPIKRRLGLYFETYQHSINGEEVLPFMRSLRRSLGRGVIFVLDLLNAHRWAAREYRRRAASVESEWLPPCAQDLTPVEQV